MRTTANTKSLEGGLKALAEPTRLLIITLLAKYGELCVGQLVDALKIPQAGVSQHLKVLRYQGIVEVDREGQWAYYNLVPEKINDLVGRLKTLASGNYSIPRGVTSRLITTSITHPRSANSQFDPDHLTPSIL